MVTILFFCSRSSKAKQKALKKDITRVLEKVKVGAIEILL
jgi:hypothetical protein